ncbi:MAG: FAD-dependent oxidoreductase [Planctomycetota bacterium]
MSKIPSHSEVLILGGGPAGIEAALRARHAGYQTTLLEAGSIGDSVLRWEHVRLFSPWGLHISKLGKEALAAQGSVPLEENALCSGAELVERYLLPLAGSQQLHGCVHTGVKAIAAARVNTLKGELIADACRGDQPFRVLWTQDDQEGTTECQILIDATGVYRTPNPSGCGGLTAPGEGRAAAQILRHMPDPMGRDRPRLSGKRILLVGAGYSAATVVRDLVNLLEEVPETRLTWAVRHQRPPVTEIANDPLPERQQLSRIANAIAAEPPCGLNVLRGVSVSSFQQQPRGVRVVLEGDGREIPVEVDWVISLTGYRPDLSLLAELQVHHCYATDGLMKISAHLLASDNGGDCLSAEPASPDTLQNPEPRLFIIGSKSYGRYPHYLMRTGIQQVELVFGSLLEARHAGQGSEQRP